MVSIRIRAFVLAYSIVGPTILALFDKDSLLTEYLLALTVLLAIISSIQKFSRERRLLGLFLAALFFTAIFFKATLNSYFAVPHIDFLVIIPGVIFGFLYNTSELGHISDDLVNFAPKWMLLLLVLTITASDEALYSIGEYGYYSIGLLGSFGGVLSLLKITKSAAPERLTFLIYILFFILTMISGHRTSILSLFFCSSILISARYGLLRLFLSFILLSAVSWYIFLYQLLNVDYLVSKLIGIGSADFDDYSSGRASIWSAVINNWSEIGLFPVDPIAAYENFGGMHSISLDLILGFGIFGFLISVWFYGGILLFRRKFNTLGILLIYGASNLTLTGWYLIEPVFWLTCGILIYETKEKITRSRYQSIS